MATTSRAVLIIRKLRDMRGTDGCPECGSGQHGAAACPAILRARSELVAAFQAAPRGSAYALELQGTIAGLDKAIAESG